MSRVLIVEDDPLISFSLQLILRAEGVEPIVADSLGEAVWNIDAFLPDFVLLDVNVPDGTTYDLARRLRASHTPFAFTSGSRYDDIPADLRDEIFLSKPCRAQLIVDTVREGLALPAAQRNLPREGR